ncbi:MAG: hypothetical protein AAFY88_27990, partial [Acidobacteriota bacterium]
LWLGSATFHFTALFERSLWGFRYELLFLLPGLLYFTIAEGFFGGGVGKHRRGLKVERPDGSRPGPLRAFARIALPIAAVEAVRLPIIFTAIGAREITVITGMENLIYTLATTLCPWLVAAAFNGTARPENGFATPWDLLSGTRVVERPADAGRPAVADVPAAATREATRPAGPFQVDGEIVPGRWLTGVDPVLRRAVWLLKRRGAGPSEARQQVGRPGRPRWLQCVELDGDDWDVYAASPGAPLRRILADGPVPWSDQRHWLHDLASELWASDGDGSRPARLGLDHVWLTTSGRALLLDEPWPAAGSAEDCAETIDVGELDGQQRFLGSVAEHTAHPPPLHAVPVLRNLRGGRFEKLSFIAGTLRGLLERPATLGRPLRAGAVLMLPVYSLAMILIGTLETRSLLEV